MKNEQQQLSDMYGRVTQVFPVEFLNTLAPQQERLVNAAIHRVVEKEGHDALTLPRLEGIKELVTQHLWSPALSEASKSSPASAMETSETSGSTPPKSSGSAPGSQASSEATAPQDLQNLPEDPALGAIKAMQTRLQGQSTTDDKED
jgi:hypothetical protein